MCSSDLTALQRAAVAMGPSLTLAAIATAACFFSFVPTDYSGLAELGFIAGSGMIVAYLLCATMLPALLKLMNPQGEVAEVGFVQLAGADRFLRRNGRPILIGALALTLGGLALLPLLEFDANPLNLRSRSVESMQALLDLMKDPDTSPNTIEILTPSLAAANDLAKRLSALPEVDKTMTLESFVPEGQPIVWRGPLIGGAIQQFLRDVEWGELDYLVVDLPPGTSDAQLTLAQAVPIAGTVLVTTPQDVALSDVTKALAMFRRMNVPIIGIVENMSAFACPHCGDLTEIFGRGGAERLAKEEGIELLGHIPLELAVRQGGDAGIPTVAQREPGPAAQALKEIAGKVAARLAVRAVEESAPTLTVA